MPRHQASRSASIAPVRAAAAWIPALLACWNASALAQVPDSLQIRPGFSTTAPEQPQAVEAIDRMEQQLLDASVLITDPSERSRELERAARALLLSQNLDSAFQAIKRSGEAAILVSQPSVRDARLDAASTTALALSEQLIQRGISGQRTALDTLPADPNAPPALPDSDRLAFLDHAVEAYVLADDFASRIASANFRSVALARATISLGKKSQDVARFAAELAGTGPLIDRVQSPFRDRADLMLAAAATTSRKIPLPAWRDRTLVELVTISAASHQYRRSLEIARSSPYMLSRAEALITIAQGQAIDRLDNDATASYQEALETIVRIPLVGPRRTVAAVMLDSLLSVGRFEDARTAISVVRDPDIRLAALSAVARSMGARGLVDSAYQWINNEAPIEFRDRLRREVADGLAEFVEQRQLRQSNFNLRDVS